MNNYTYFRRRTLIIFFSIFMTIIVCYMIVMSYKGRDKFRDNDYCKMSLVGTYSYDGGMTNEILDSSTVLTPTKEKEMVIRGHVTEDVPESRPLYFFVQGLRVKIWVNDELILEHNNVTDETWVHINTPHIKSSDDIRIELKSDKTYMFNVYFLRFVDRIYSTTSFALIALLFKQNLFSLLACLVTFIMGITILVYTFLFKRMGEFDSEGLKSCGFIMIIGGMTCFIDYNYVTLLMPNLFLLRSFDHLCQSLIVLFITGYMRRYLESERSKKRCEIFIIIIGVMISIYMLKSMIISSNDAEFDALFVIFVMAVVFIFTYELIELYRNGISLSRRSRIAFESVILIVLSFIMEMVYFILTGNYIIRIFLTTLLFFSLLQYYLLVSANVENYAKAKKATALERELNQNKIKMVISQIQPHFLYNAISTIRALCTRNPLEARNGLDYFAKYLRANMDSLSEEGCIPFAKELDHVKSYIYIEKLRFGDLLEVEYDINATEFVCPPLCLQTIAENAVKHGLLAKKDGGKLKISTKETEYCYEITVEDNGVGFDMTKPLDNGRSHVGLANTRQRIAGLCNGTVSVGSKLGEGTTITITLPKKGNE